MFENHNHVHAVTTAIGTLGGFQSAPEWFTKAAQNSIWQILMASVLVYQGGGGLDWGYSVVVAILFYTAVEMSRYIAFGGAKDLAPAEEAPVGESAAEEAPQQEEYYYNY
tara:strand:+ start:245 stop:574 length:330 start_codon:yes stop_codon:yes gene_type:complete